MASYPAVEYEEMYVLERGYRNFFQTFAASVSKVWLFAAILLLNLNFGANLGFQQRLLSQLTDMFSHHQSYVEMVDEPEQLG